MRICIVSESRAVWTVSDGKRKRRRKKQQPIFSCLRNFMKHEIIQKERIRGRRDRNTTVFTGAEINIQIESTRVLRQDHRSGSVKAFATTTTTTGDGEKNDAQKIATTKKSTPITGVLKAVVRAFLLSLIVAGFVIYGTKILLGNQLIFLDLVLVSRLVFYSVATRHGCVYAIYLRKREEADIFNPAAAAATAAAKERDI